MECDFDKIFGISLSSMRLIGCDPYSKQNLKWLLKFLLFHGEFTVMFLVAAYNVIFVNFKANDFSLICKNSVMIVMYTAITFQFCIMLWKARHIRMLIDTVKSDYFLAKSQPLKEQLIIQLYAKKGHSVCQQWLVLTFFGTVIFPVKNIAVNTWYWIKTGEFLRVHMYTLVFPPFIENKKDSNWVFLMIFVVITGYAAYASVMYCAFVPLGPTLMLHACGQLEVVKTRIEKVYQSEDIEEVRQNLNGIVKQLQHIYDFVDTIKLCFTLAYELTLKTTAVFLPITCYEVLESLKRGDVTLEFITFIVGGAIFSSTPCYYGDILMEKGEDVRLAIYSCGWEKTFDRALRSNILIMLHRGLQPVAIRTLFRTMCLDALTDTFQLSYTIFNLMNAAWN